MVSTIKEEVAAFYLPTYEEIERGMREGHLVHVDETRVSVKGALGCVWVSLAFKMFYTSTPIVGKPMLLRKY